MIGNAQYWAFLLLAALGATALAQYAIPGAAGGAPGTAEAVAAGLLGGAATLLVLPAVVVIPWRHVQARRRQITNTPLYVGTALFALLALVALIGAAAGPAA